MTDAKIWRDVYGCYESIELTGWRRYVDNGWIHFTAEGDRIVNRHASREPVEAQPVRYVFHDETGPLETVAVE